MCHFFCEIVWVGAAAVQILYDIRLLNLMALSRGWWATKRRCPPYKKASSAKVFASQKLLPTKLNGIDPTYTTYTILFCRDNKKWTQLTKGLTV